MDNNINLTVSNGPLQMPENMGERFFPIVTSSGPVLYPHSLMPLTVEPDCEEAVRFAMKHGRTVGVFVAMPDEDMQSDMPQQVTLQCSHFQYGERNFATVGVKARIVKMLHFPDGQLRVLLRGVKRVRFTRLTGNQSGVRLAYYEELKEQISAPTEVAGLNSAVVKQFQEFAKLQGSMPEELRVAVLNLESPVRIADLIAEAMSLSPVEHLALLTLPTIKERLQLLLFLLNRELEIARVGMKIQADVHSAISQSQREYFLREQLKTIQRELGEETRNPDIVEAIARLEAGNYPAEVVEVVNKELSRLEIIPQASPEYHVSYNYIDHLLRVPWTHCSEDRLDVAEAEKTLDEDHYGLKDVKERILEFLSVLQLREDGKSPILCLVGPPGVGKTSLGQSIARAMNREFVRMSLGGVRDEAEIRGHRRTYVGALPGRIMQNLEKIGVANPVFMLDEIDKLAHDQRGDPASALLEVLDPAQNKAFNDHYLELDYDLSKVFFIATANVMDQIPEPLLDRMEMIRLPGYTSFEKRQIAKRYLVPRQFKENGLTRSVHISMAAIDEIIDYYTREAGVRQLEQTIGRLCRKIARKVVEGEIDTATRYPVDAVKVRELLGIRKFQRDSVSAAPEIGVATGMAWTSVGGTILPVEVAAMPGKGQLKLTGSLGKVMQESAETAYSLVRTRAETLHIAPEVFDKQDFHIHVPDGATPKDGPSAGITITTALVSLLSETPVRPKLAMTGEITLRGKVTAIGGVKEKVIAAMRSGVKTVMMPEDNRKDLEELPDEVRSKLDFIFVKDIDSALKVALQK